MLLRPACAVAAVCATADPALAHVKWFAAYNVAAPPAPLSAVLSGDFLWLLLTTTNVLFIIFLIDCLLADHGVDRTIERALRPLKSYNPDVLRVGTGVFLLCLWLLGGIILTPELKTQSQSLSWFQLALAICALSWRTTFVTGAGLIVLYGIGVYQYGLFHLMDYPLFLGIGVYLIIVSLRLSVLTPYALPILYVATAQTLLWASIEKWAYWNWTIPLLERHPNVTFGIEPRAYILLAGFVEFAATFVLVVGRISLRIVAFGLLIIFVAAIVDFGKIDAVGHLLIIATLWVMVTNGNTRLSQAFHSDETSYLVECGKLLSLFFLFLVFYFAQYYALHALLF